jgi:putative hydrolase of the HAD superfamily
MINGVIFDIGGVLIDDPQFKSFWGESKKGAELRELFGTGKISREGFVKDGAHIIGVSPDIFLTQYIEAYSQMKRIPQTMEVFNSINKQKYIFSDTNPIHLEICQKLFPEIFESSSKQFLSYEMKLRKNSNKAFQLMLNNLPYKAHELIFIDNNPNYIETAKSLGLNTILFNAECNLTKSLLQIDQNMFD